MKPHIIIINYQYCDTETKQAKKTQQRCRHADITRDQSLLSVQTLYGCFVQHSLCHHFGHKLNISQELAAIGLPSYGNRKTQHTLCKHSETRKAAHTVNPRKQENNTHYVNPRKHENTAHTRSALRNRKTTHTMSTLGNTKTQHTLGQPSETRKHSTHLVSPRKQENTAHTRLTPGNRKTQHTLGQPSKTRKCGCPSGREIKNGHIHSLFLEKRVFFLHKERNAPGRRDCCYYYYLCVRVYVCACVCVRACVRA